MLGLNTSVRWYGELQTWVRGDAPDGALVTPAMETGGIERGLLVGCCWCDLSELRGGNWGGIAANGTGDGGGQRESGPANETEHNASVETADGIVGTGGGPKGGNACDGSRGPPILTPIPLTEERNTDDVFLRFFHLARRFWNHTWSIKWCGALHLNTYKLFTEMEIYMFGGR